MKILIDFWGIQPAVNNIYISDEKQSFLKN